MCLLENILTYPPSKIPPVDLMTIVSKPSKKIAELANAYNDPVKLLRQVKTEPEEIWLQRGEAMALELFRMMAKRVPAYKDWLKKNKIDPLKIKTIADFSKIPTIDKDNYLRQYPLTDLCWDGKLSQGWRVYSATSGSTGEPFYFPRGNFQDQQYAITAEMYLLNNFQIDKKTTLYVDGFAMGAWIGGLFTYQAVKNVAERGRYNLSIITPGINKQEIIKSIIKLGPNYDQVILGGYPPFVKDVIDEGLSQGIKWQDYNLRIIFSAEAFSEKFRDYIAERIGLPNIYSLTLNHYGTVDQGTIAHETPVSVLIRRLAMTKPEIFESIFGQTVKVPTLTQYLPEMFYFEIENGKDIVCSAFSGIPLVRYDLKDNGGVLTFAEIKEKLASFGVNLEAEIKQAGITRTLMNLPFVFVYERADLSVCLSGANVYPEPIKRLIVSPKFQKYLTGKFTMLVERDKKQDPNLIIHLETKKNTRPTKLFVKFLKKEITEILLSENSEYRDQYNYNKKRALPKIKLWPCGHSTYFNLKGKQQWIMKIK